MHDLLLEFSALISTFSSNHDIFQCTRMSGYKKEWEKGDNMLKWQLLSPLGMHYSLALSLFANPARHSPPTPPQSPLSIMQHAQHAWITKVDIQDPLQMED